jgi:hypothetical protein
MFTFRKTAGVAAALALALSLSACSSSSDTAAETPAASAPAASAPASPTSSVGAANEAFCTSSAALKSEIENLRTLVTGGSVTVEALQAQREAIKAAGEQAKTDAQALDAAVQAGVTGAQAAFQTAIDAIPADQTGLKEVAAYTAAAVVFAKAVDAIDNEVGCS